MSSIEDISGIKGDFYFRVMENLKIIKIPLNKIFVAYLKVINFLEKNRRH